MKHSAKVALLTAMIAILGLIVQATGQVDWPTSPKTDNGKKWRIGYLEGGVFYSYGPYLSRTIEGLMELDWIERAELPALDSSGDARPLWAWLVREAKSEYLEFVEDAYWSCNWNDKNRKQVRAPILERLNLKKDIDLMLALGTWAGEDLATNEISVPTMVMSSSNPVSSGIIKSVEDSGYDHLHASVSPKRYERQIRLFHEATKFKRLGIAYENTAEGRTYAAIEDVERVARERNFQVVRCYCPSDIPDPQEAYKGLLKCHEELAPQVDAVYLTMHNGNEPKNLPSLLAPLNRHKILTFAQRSSEEVKHGVLMSLTTAATAYMGLFEALTMVKIFNGAKPRSLPNAYDDPTTRVAVNMAVAQQIGYDPSVWLLEMADELYKEVNPVEFE
jgi:ABC-type uncharacterized transport system substrate-binding protein